MFCYCLVKLGEVFYIFLYRLFFFYHILVNKDEYIVNQARRVFAVLTIENYLITKSFKNDKL